MCACLYISVPVGVLVQNLISGRCSPPNRIGSDHYINITIYNASLIYDVLDTLNSAKKAFSSSLDKEVIKQHDNNPLRGSTIRLSMK